jgi:putative FmdB family regulatory protein
MPNYDYHCAACDTVQTILVPYEKRDDPGVPCPGCGAYGPGNECLERLMVMPNTTRASYVDGHRRKGWDDLREANKLAREKAVAKGESRKEIAREIRKLGVRVEKD